MSITNQSELEGVVEAGRVVASIREALRRFARPGRTTGELDELAGEMMREAGAVSAPRREYDFPGHSCISLNQEVAHGIPGSRKLREGDLINIDISLELNGFYSDTGISFVVGDGDSEKHRLCQAAGEALEAGLARIRTGRYLREIGRAMHDSARRAGFTVIKNLTGHGIGRRLHEEPEILTYEDPRDRRRLTEGLVLAVESFVSTGAEMAVTAKDGWTLRTPDGSYVAQREHTIVVTKQGPLVVTA